MEFSQVLYTRRSCRAYTAEPVSEEQLHPVLAAGNAAPVGMGAYGTVRMTVIRNQAFMAALNKATAEFMKRDMLNTADCHFVKVQAALIYGGSV